MERLRDRCCSDCISTDVRNARAAFEQVDVNLIYAGQTLE